MAGFGSRPLMGPYLALLVALPLLLSACGENSSVATRSQRQDPSPPAATPSLNPSLAGRIETDQRVYEPGDEVRVRWSGEELRGIAYSLDAWTGTDWKTQFYVSAITQGHRPAGGPVWWDTSETNHGWDDIGVGGPGPDIAVVPDIADPGTYRLCTANSPKKSCALITVEAAL